jgi:polyisoprenoid-binding protein YceI
MTPAATLKSWTAAFILLSGTMLAADRTIDVAKSTLAIHVGKSGLFSVAGHEHWVDAPIARGSFRDGPNAAVEFVVEARRLKVRPDQESAQDQAKIQATMQREVLEIEKYPEIVFRSTSVAATGDHSWRVTGTLNLHGVTKPIVAEVRQEGAAYLGNARLKQTDFGIKRVSAGGGTVKVKDELEITFKVYGQ